jgi:hypothetical protein
MFAFEPLAAGNSAQFAGLPQSVELPAIGPYDLEMTLQDPNVQLMASVAVFISGGEGVSLAYRQYVWDAGMFQPLGSVPPIVHLNAGDTLRFEYTAAPDVVITPF